MRLCYILHWIKMTVETLGTQDIKSDSQRGEVGNIASSVKACPRVSS